MKVFAIDPGPEVSAWVLYDSEARAILNFSNEEVNQHLLDAVLPLAFGPVGDRIVLAVEMIASYGMPVGMTTFETCVWIGRYVEAVNQRIPVDYDWRVYRSDVKSHVCHDSRAKDPNIRRALLDRWPAGNKKDPGKTYGLSGDGWAALAVAVTVAEGGVRHKTIAQQQVAAAQRRLKKREKAAVEKAAAAQQVLVEPGE